MTSYRGVKTSIGLAIGLSAFITYWGIQMYFITTPRPDAFGWYSLLVSLVFSICLFPVTLIFNGWLAQRVDEHYAAELFIFKAQMEYLRKMYDKTHGDDIDSDETY
jgi:hypothetical protein